MNISITGASGFIGREVVKFHLKLNDEVRYLTRTDKQPVPKAKAFIEDVNAPASQLLPFLSNVNTFYHCAGEISDESVMRKTHVYGTANLLKVVEQRHSENKGIFHWIQLSSCGAYGQVYSHPSDARYVDELTTERPTGEYECTKTESDQLIVSFAEKHDWFKYTIIRPTNVFGIGMRSTAIDRITQMIQKRLFFYVGSSDSIANFVHVDDVVSAMVLSANQKKAFNQIFIVANDCKFQDLINTIADTLKAPRPRLKLNELMLRKFISIIGEWIKLPINNTHIDVMMRQTYYSNSKLKTYLNWEPKAPVLLQLKEYISIKHG